MGIWHHAVLTVLFLMIGSAVGSFLNVCVYRLPRGLSVLRPRSHCPRCRSAVAARDNLPIIGWLLLRGRCRVCGGAISARYPAVELATGLIFAGVYLTWIALSGTDVWENTGAVNVVIRLAVLWSLLAIAESATLIYRDTRASVLT